MAALESWHRTYYTDPPEDCNASRLQRRWDLRCKLGGLNACVWHGWARAESEVGVMERGICSWF